MPHIFVSYSKKDTQKLAFTLCDALEQIPGVTVWVDRDLVPGRSFPQQITREIDRCDVMVVLISPDVNRDDPNNPSFVLNEIEYARSRQKYIIPVLAQETEPLIQLAAYQYIDYARSQREGLKQLVEAIATRAGVRTSDIDAVTGKIMAVVNNGGGIPLPVGTGVARPPSGGGQRAGQRGYTSWVIAALMAAVVLVIGGILVASPFDRPISTITPTTTETPNAGTRAAQILQTTQAPTITPTQDLTSEIETAIAQILFSTYAAATLTADASGDADAGEEPTGATAGPSATLTATANRTATAAGRQTATREAVQQIALATEAVATSQAAESTRVAQATNRAPTNTLEPTLTPTPTETRTPTATATVTATFTPSPDQTERAAATATQDAALTEVYRAALTQVAATETPAGTGDVQLCDYVISYGDLLGQIAIDIGIDVEAIVEVNPDMNPRVIVPGQSIKIPCSGEPGYSPSYRLTTNRQWTPVEQVVDGYTMVLAPTGCFRMGSGMADDELPQHPQCFNQPFWIDKYEVTNAQYGSHGRFEGDNLPRENVTWAQARDFCLARGGSLPTEAQWEYASRGPDSLTYPWGNDFDGTRLNSCDASCELPDRDSSYDDGYEFTAPVGSFPAGVSWVGALDMSGNVWEWTSTVYLPLLYPYPYNSRDGRENQEIGQGERVRRGGSWDYSGAASRAANRLNTAPTSTASDLGVIGFRCVLPYDPAADTSPTLPVRP